MSAASVQLKMDPSMAFILTGDFNAQPDSQLINYILAGSANIPLVPFKRCMKGKQLSKVPCPIDQSKPKAFKFATRALRDVAIPSATRL
ncbi:hypothetical protein BGZ68_003048 [Mortierella alpina]|nr:hypothetical protein BGZ68_003048 [Mortierella alpina]